MKLLIVAHGEDDRSAQRAKGRATGRKWDAGDVSGVPISACHHLLATSL